MKKIILTSVVLISALFTVSCDTEDSNADVEKIDKNKSVEIIATSILKSKDSSDFVIVANVYTNGTVVKSDTISFDSLSNRPIFVSVLEKVDTVKKTDTLIKK